MSEESDERSDTTTDQSTVKSDTSCPTVTEITSETSESGGSSGMASNSSRESVRLSPDECSIMISQKKITIEDKPRRLRSETRGQFMCHLALQFTRNQHKKVTPPPRHNSDNKELMYAYSLYFTNYCLRFYV